MSSGLLGAESVQVIPLSDLKRKSKSSPVSMGRQCAGEVEVVALVRMRPEDVVLETVWLDFYITYRRSCLLSQVYV